jgi:hypothetical protein
VYTAVVVEYVRFAGAASFTVIEIVAVALPVEFDAVTVCEVAGDNAEGVPEITPVTVFKVRPAGSAGETAYEVAAPASFEGVFATIATPVV